MQALLDVYKIRQDFPILKRSLTNGKKLVYLDNAATTQKPKQVIDAICKYYSEYNSNIHRAVYQIVEEATAEYEKPGKIFADLLMLDILKKLFSREIPQNLST